MERSIERRPPVAPQQSGANVSVSEPSRRPILIATVLGLALPAIGYSGVGAEVAPQLFEPGVISAGANDGAPTFAPDGKELYFERTNGRWSAIMVSRLVNGHWALPELAAFSDSNSSQQPAFSPDGRYLIFVSSRPALLPEKSGHRFINHLYRVDRAAGAWSKPVELPAEVNVSDRVFKPSVAANGDLYFMADTQATAPPKWKLYRARKIGQGYMAAEPLPFTQEGDVDPYIAPDQSFLIFSSNTRDSTRGAFERLYMVGKRGESWADARPIRYAGDRENADDGEAQLSPDGARLFFTSSRVMPVDRTGGRDIAVATVERMNVWDNGNSNVWVIPANFDLNDHRKSE